MALGEVGSQQGAGGVQQGAVLIPVAVAVAGRGCIMYKGLPVIK
jgi:hypothetical protein